MNEELKALLAQPTADIPDVGRICFQLSRNGSYAAAKAGTIPTIKVGRRREVVPTSWVRKVLGLDAE